jgi:hypothetical protein
MGVSNETGLISPVAVLFCPGASSSTFDFVRECFGELVGDPLPAFIVGNEGCHFSATLPFTDCVCGAIADCEDE